MDDPGGVGLHSGLVLLADDTGAVYGMRRNALTQRFLLRHAFTDPLTNVRLELGPASSVSSRIFPSAAKGR